MAKATKKKIALNAYILVDRSGSMAARWDETISSINAYVDQLAKDKLDAKITIATFDEHSGFQFDVVRNAVPIADYVKFSAKDANPRGSTPLLDAVVRITGLAQSANDEKTVIVVMTDGAENASREATKEKARAAVDACKARGWEVIFLGADFNAFNDAMAVGVGISNTLNMSSGNFSDSLRSLASKTTMYANVGASMTFSSDDRVNATKAPPINNAS